MAIYHVSVKSFSRGKGQSGTAGAAYRAGLRIVDERTGKVSDYTRRGGVVGWEMLAPKGAPDWCREPAEFWNRSEQAETRANARTGREVEISLPHELTAEQRQALAHDLGQAMVERYGVAALVAIHEPHSRGEDERNHHVHLLLSARQVGPAGLGDRAMAEFDARKGAGADAVRDLREHVGAVINRHLAAAQVQARVSHLSLKDQAHAALARGDVDMAAALTRAPTVHEGKATTAARRQGHVLERAAWNDGVRVDNRRGLDEYLKEATRGGRVVADQQRVDDVTGEPVKKRQPQEGRDVATRRHPGQRLGPSLGDATGARGRSGPAAHAERAQAAKVAKGPDGVKKSKEQKHEEARAAEAAALAQQWLAAQIALADQYLESLRGAMADERRLSEIASEILGRLNALGQKAARREAWAEFKAEAEAWKPRRVHMLEVVHTVKRQGEVKSEQARQKRARMDARDAGGAREHYQDRLTTWEQTHPRPGEGWMHQRARAKWSDDPARQRYIRKLRDAEKAEREARQVMMTEADLADLDLQASVIQQRMDALEAERRAKWAVPSDWAAATVAARFPERKPPEATPAPVVTPAALEEARRRRSPGLRPPGSRP